MNETNQAPAAGGTKLSTIFMVVLGLHIVVIVVITAFYFMKGRSTPEMAETSTPAIPEGQPVIENSQPAPGLQASADPVVDTHSAPLISPEMMGAMTEAEPASPMPATSDPYWSNPEPAPAETTVQEHSDLLAENHFQPAPARIEPPVKPAPVVPAKKTVVTTVSKPKSYTVVSGDNLTKIAKKNGTTVAKLKQANGLTGDALKIGQVLKVPGTKTTTAVVAKGTEKKAAAPSAPLTAGSYQVVAGDNLTKIARKSGTTVAELKRVNGLTSDDLKIGTTLKLPRSAATKASPKAEPVREAEASVPVRPFRAPVIPMDVVSL